MSNKKKYEVEKEMAESRKMKTEKGLALVPGANPLADGCNFAVADSPVWIIAVG